VQEKAVVLLINIDIHVTIIEIDTPNTEVATTLTHWHIWRK